MQGRQSGGSGRNWGGPQLARIRGQEPIPSSTHVSDHGATKETEDRTNGFLRRRNECSPSRMSSSSSLNQKTPARSYFQHSFLDSHGEIQLTQTRKDIVY